MKKILLFSLMYPFLTFGFVPPVVGIIKEIFDSRRPGLIFELSYKHNVEVSPGTSVVVDESMLFTPGRAYFLWKTASHVPVYGVEERKNFSIGGDRKMAPKSLLYSKYLGSGNGEDFKEQLVSEQFVRRDQLLQYKPGFNFEGDPDSWQIQENYVKHPDIQYKRLNALVVIAVKGMDDGQNQRTVFFDNKQQGIRRLEWKEGSNTSSWNFSDFNRYQDGFFPKVMRFEQNGGDLVNSELIQVRGLKDKAFQSTLKAWQKSAGKNAATGSLEEALKVLLSHR